MTNKMGLMALGLSMALLSGCGSSDNDATETTTAAPATTDAGTTDSTTTDAGTTAPATTDAGTTAPATTTASGFTSDLLVGKTYVIIDGDEEETVSFTETEMSYTGNGATGTGTYTIDENGILIVDTPEGQATLTLTGIEDSGDLNVNNDGVATVWVLMS